MTSHARFAIAHFQKKWKSEARVGARSVVGSFGGRTSLKTNARAPSHNSTLAHPRPSFPLFLKVRYSWNVQTHAVNRLSYICLSVFTRYCFWSFSLRPNIVYNTWRLWYRLSATPSKPKITSVHFNDATAVVKWRPGYDGGYPQQMEVWYRLATDNDYEWNKSPLLSASVTSYDIANLLPEQSYYFSIRGINREGAGRFSDMVEAKGVPPVINRTPKKEGK